MFLRGYTDRLVVLDEVQRVLGLFEVLRGLIDERRRAGSRHGHFLLLGSASLDLLRQSAESLAGRIAYVEMTGILATELPPSGPDLDRLWLRGGLPCYACHRKHALLGNVVTLGARAVLGRRGFCDLSRHTVDTNPKCRGCEVRYLCGGACRAWGGEQTQHDLDAAPEECEGLRTRACAVYEAAKTFLELG